MSPQSALLAFFYIYTNARGDGQVPELSVSDLIITHPVVVSVRNSQQIIEINAAMSSKETSVTAQFSSTPYQERHFSRVEIGSQLLNPLLKLGWKTSSVILASKCVLSSKTLAPRSSTWSTSWPKIQSDGWNHRRHIRLFPPRDH